MKKNFAFLFLVTLVISCTSHEGTDKKDGKAADATTSLRPDTMKPPNVTLLDTCPAPVVIPVRTVAQTAGFYVPMTNYTPQDGVYSSVTCIKKDHTGSLWFGSSGGGAYRYDGKTFTNYSTTQGLVHSEVVSITEDRSGNMWFATPGGGVSRYDGKKFTTFADSLGLGSGPINCIITDKNGKLWFATAKNGVICYDPRLDAGAGSKRFTAYKTEQGLASNSVTSIVEDKTGNLWFGTKEGVSKYDPLQKKTAPHLFTNYTIADGLAHNDIVCITEDKAGNIWFCTNGGGVTRYDPLGAVRSGAKTFTTYTHDRGLANNAILCVLADGSGKVWFGTANDGVSCYDPEKDAGTGSRPFTNYTVTQGLASNDILSIGEDNNGSIWFGTAGSGACRYDGRAFTTYSSEQGLAANAIIAIVEDRGGDLWFATDGTGVSRYEAYPQDGGPARFITYTTAQGIAGNTANGMLVDRNGDIWLATGGGGISRYTTQRNSSTPCFINYTTAQGIADNSLSSVAEDNQGNLWFGTYRNGVSRFDGKTFTNYSTAQGLSNDRVNTVLADKAGNVWMGTSGGGVCCFEAAASAAKGKATFRTYTTLQGLGSNFVYTIWQDKSGNIWIGTDGGGVSRFDGKTFTTFNAANGLGSNAVYSIKEDKNRNIWFGTNDGFIVLTGDRKKTEGSENSNLKLLPADNLHHNSELAEDYEPVFEKYHFKNGYPVKDVNSNAMYIDSKGIVWAGSGDKLVRFHYSSIHKNPEPPHVFLDAVKVDGEPICWSDLNSKSAVKDSMTAVNEEVRTFGNVLTTERRDSMVRKFAHVGFDSVTRFYSIPLDLVLPYKHNKVTFEFGANELARPHMVRYQYILEGYDKDWETLTDKTSAAFGNIHEGTYTFKLKAQSPDGVWSEPISYTFTVSPPPYRTWWAYGLYICTLVYLTIIIFRWRTASLRREKEQLEKIVIERTAQVVEEKAKVVKLVEEQEQTIADRTAELANANKKLVELIQYNAHYMREPLARVMGAISISEFVEHEEFINDIIPQMTRAVNDLDNAIKEVIKVADETVELKK